MIIGYYSKFQIPNFKLDSGSSFHSVRNDANFQLEFQVPSSRFTPASLRPAPYPVLALSARRCARFFSRSPCPNTLPMDSGSSRRGRDVRNDTARCLTFLRVPASPCHRVFNSNPGHDVRIPDNILSFPDLTSSASPIMPRG